MKFLSKFEGVSYAALRAMVGFLFLWHGSMKLFNFPIAFSHKMNVALQYTAGSIELVGGVLVMIGLMTRLSAFVCSGMMAVAYWMAHGGQSLYPIINKGELAVLYCFVFLFIACRGGGAFSIDSLRK